MVLTARCFDRASIFVRSLYIPSLQKLFSVKHAYKNIPVK